MKQIITLIFSFSILLSLKASAQEFKFGASTGSTFANATLTDKPEDFNNERIYYPQAFFNLNGYVGYKSKSFWGVSLEPGFIQKGGKTKGDYNSKIKQNYFQLPILADLYVGEKFYLSIGPEIAYMINAKVKSDIDKSDITDIYDNRLELSALIGVNYNIYKNFDIGLRYNRGLTYTQELIWTGDTGEIVGTSKVYNQYFQFLVKFKI